MRELMAMFNPPVLQRGEDVCYGHADPIRNFGDTEDTSALILKPDVQKRLLKGEIPYKCKSCNHIYFIERKLLEIYTRSMRRQNKSGLPTDLVCQKSHFVVNRDGCVPQIVSLVTGTAAVTPITIPITG